MRCSGGPAAGAARGSVGLGGSGHALAHPVPQQQRRGRPGVGDRIPARAIRLRLHCGESDNPCRGPLTAGPVGTRLSLVLCAQAQETSRTKQHEAVVARIQGLSHAKERAC